MKPQQVTGSGIQIAGTTYLTATVLARELRVSRTTLYRWRQEGKVPAGRRDRRRMVLFTLAEAQVVRDYAERLEPATVKRAATAMHQEAPSRRKL
jgi:predicted site-specific integrase-resolvase